MGVCLVTGGAGFLGSHVVAALVRAGHIVRVLDNFTSGSLANLAEVIDDIELHPGDLTEQAFLARAMRGVELVFHFGGAQGGSHAHNGRSGEAAKGTLNILSAALETRVRRLLVASSLEVYGPFRAGLRDEADLTEPLTAHGRVLLSSELACAICTKMSGLETVRLRFFNIFGPRQSLESPFAGMIRRAVESMSLGRSPVFDGHQRCGQDLLYVDDAVHATLLAARSSRVSGKVYNIGRGHPVYVQEVVEVLNSLMGTNLEPEYRGTPCVAFDNIASVRRAETELGFCAAMDLRGGLRRMIDSVARLAPAAKACAGTQSWSLSTG